MVFRVSEGPSFLGRRSHGLAERQGLRSSFLGKVRVREGEREMEMWGPGTDCWLGRGSSGIGRCLLGSGPGGFHYCRVFFFRV